jgi:hypothetical protein
MKKKKQDEHGTGCNTGSQSARRRRDRSSLLCVKHVPYHALNSGRSRRANMIPAQQSFTLRFEGQVHVGTTLSSVSLNKKPFKFTMWTRITVSFMCCCMGTCSEIINTLSSSCLMSVQCGINAI